MSRKRMMGWAGLSLIAAAGCGGTPAVAPSPSPAKTAPPASATPSAAPATAPSSSAAPSAALEIVEPACAAPPACQDGCAAPRQLALGNGHACALEASGDLACWGDNDAGELGDGTRISRASPVRAQAKGLVQIALGDEFTCGLDASGKVECWGLESWPLPDLKEMEAACKRDGGGPGCESILQVSERLEKLKARPKKRRIGKPPPVSAPPPPEPPPAQITPPIVDAVAVAAGGARACALRKSGAVDCFLLASPRSTTRAILGDGDQGKAKPVAKLGAVKEIVVGDLMQCARTAAGRVRCWSPSDAPADVPGIEDATGIAAGAQHACAVRQGGGVTCWGNWERGQLGIGRDIREEKRDAPPREALVIRDAVEVRAAEYSTCARTEKGDVYCWGRFGPAYFEGSHGVRYLWTPERISGLAPASSLAVGDGFACAMTTAGIQCWGDTSRGKLGNGEMAEQTVPVAAPLAEPAVGLDASPFETCAVTISGKVVCWGFAHTKDTSLVTSGAAVHQIQGLDDAVQVSVEDGQACAAHRSGKVSFWQRGAWTAPEEIPDLTDAVWVSATVVGGCASRKNGEFVCFPRAVTPSKVPGVSDIASFEYGATDWSCGLKTSGEPLCWQMPIWVGFGAVPAPTLVAFPGVKSAVSVSTAMFRACAVEPTGKVMCMGSMSHSRVDPMSGVSDAVTVSLESSSTIGTLACAATRSGQVMCTSSSENRFGELGTGDLTPAPYPGTATVRGLSDVVEVAAGGNAACARDKAGRVLCWGSDAMGQVSGKARGLTMCAVRAAKRP